MSTTATEAKPEAGAEAGKKGGKKKLVVIVLLVAVLGGAGYWFFLKPSSGAAPPPKPGEVVALEPIQVNLADGHYLRIGIALQLTATAHEADARQAVAQQPTDRFVEIRILSAEMLR
jgi:flagellar FliL protein